MANRNIERAVRVALLTAGAVSVGAYSSGALAQTQPTGPTPDEVEQIIVTGSRIPQPNLEGTSPVTMVGQQEVKLEGTMNVENLVNNLPMAFADQGGNISNGASGTATVNLRNLGADRTLVLVNGRRLPAGSPRGPVAPDINAIPAALIKRVEVLTGGASAVYGSDAVAGVVNFILMDDFQGVQFDGNYSGYQHTNDDKFMRNTVSDAGYPKAPHSVWDGESYGLSMTMGSNFADGQGNATVFFGYSHTDALLQSERDASACALAASSTSGARYCGGSSTSFPGRFRIGNINPDGTARPGNFSRTLNFNNAPGSQVVPFNFAANAYNYGPLNYYQRPQDRYQVDAFMHYDVNDSAQVYAEFMFMDNSTVAQIAPSGDFGITTPISCSNPLLQQDNAQWYNAMCINPADGSTLSSRNFILQRRNVEGGGRQDHLDLTQYRGVVGVKGGFAEHWNYDVSAQYATVLYSEQYQNDFSRTRISRALDVVTDPNTGDPACASFVDGSDPNCVPWNIWTQNGVTPAALNYLQTPGFENGNTTQTVVTAAVSSNLGDYGLTLPTAKDGIGVAFGAEYRQEGLRLDTDVQFQTGDLAGQGGPTLPVKGSYNVTDLFGEVRVPIVQDVAFAKDLTFNGSYRYSDYSTNVSTNTYGLGLDWAIIDDVKLRGSFAHAVRAPNIIELYQAAGLGLFDMSSDPCGAAQQYDAATCFARTGLDPSLWGSADIDNGAGQYNAIFSGSTDLKPEKADTWTVGIVFTPTFIEGFSATVDYWNIKVDDLISIQPADVTLDQCLATGDAQFCDRVHRDSQGTLWLQDSGYVLAPNQNIGTTTTSGWDINMNYALSMNDWGSLNFALIGTYLDSYEVEPVPGLTTVKYDCAGLFGTTCGTPSPKWRSKFRTTWSTPWDVELSLNWRYFDSVKLDGSTNDPDLYDPAVDFKTVDSIDAQNYFDLAAVYTFAEKYTVNAGVNNILDENPPVNPYVGTGFGNGNTYPQVYDALGRYVFVGLTVKF
jgi:iron complex outermembrane receptor protein